MSNSNDLLIIGSMRTLTVVEDMVLYAIALLARSAQFAAPLF
jgi:hypothetical protein